MASIRILAAFYSIVIVNVALSSYGADKDDEKPFNILFIMADQFRQDALGCYGNKVARTPNLDWLAKQGTRFSNAYSSTPSCTPARAAILTGLSPWYHGMLGYGDMAPRYALELPRTLSASGYYTHIIGKNHFGWDGKAGKGKSHGFEGQDLYEGLPEVKDNYFDWFRSQKPDVKDPLQPTGLKYNDYRGCPYALPEFLHPTTWVGKKAVEFLENYKRVDPFFLKVSFHRPHSPYDPPGRIIKQFKQSEIPKPYVSGTWDADCKIKRPLSDIELCCGELDENTVAFTRLAYYASVTFVDEWIGKILSTLSDKNLLSKTVILFTSDHGDMLGDHYRWRKILPYEMSAKIPLIFYWPPETNSFYGGTIVTEQNTVRDEVVELRDVFPTFLDVAGLSKPSMLNGSSLLDLVRDAHSKPQWREYVDLEHSPAVNVTFYWNGLTDGHVKYIYRAYFGDEQIFDLRNDPHEMVDLSGTPEWNKELLLWRARLIDQFTREKRGTAYLEGGKLQIRRKAILYSPHYPRKGDPIVVAIKLTTKKPASSHKVPKEEQKDSQNTSFTPGEQPSGVSGNQEKQQPNHGSMPADKQPTLSLPQPNIYSQYFFSDDKRKQSQDSKQQQQQQKQSQNYQQRFGVDGGSMKKLKRLLFGMVITAVILAFVFLYRIPKLLGRALNSIYRKLKNV